MVNILPERFDRRFALAVGVLAIGILFRLGMVASETGNWRGFWYSALHVLLVGGATYYFLRDASEEQSRTFLERQQRD